MNRDRLKRIVFNQKEEVLQQFKDNVFIDRDFNLRKIKKYLSAPNVVVISGVRRSGKSTLALMALQGKNFAHINFDDVELVDFKAEDFELLLEIFYEIYDDNLEYFVFDEIQNVKNWELFITKLRRTKKIIITGSNANLLSGELATHLTGRHIDITLLPFSFKEFLRFGKFSFSEKDLFITTKIAQLNKKIDKYFRLGGFPEVYKIDKKILESIYDDILSKDVLERHNIRNQKSLKEMAHYLLSNFSERFSYRKLASVFGIKSEYTIKNYILYLENSFLFNILEQFSYKLKKQHSAPKKIYPVDTGIINKLGFQIFDNNGRIMENVVFLELQRKKMYNDTNQEIFYWQNYQGREVDFIIKEQRRVVQLIQVAHTLKNINTKEREIRSLVEASKDLRCNNLIIITRNEEDEIIVNDKKIKVIPIWKWLLQP